jgi:hypothetical protein
MPPPPRYTYHHHATTGIWYVYDRLLNRRVRIDTSVVAAADMARDQEATWRTTCERWQREEHGAGPPPPIF